MNNYDPLSAERRGIDEEDATALGMEDTDDRTDPTTDTMEANDQAEPYVPPMDPPVEPGGRDAIEVTSGFAVSDEEMQERAAPTGDDDITQRVVQMLHDDAATMTLQLDVETVDGVVYLRGEVPGLDDTDLAAEVASRVSGVVDVVDEMTVAQ